MRAARRYEPDTNPSSTRAAGGEYIYLIACEGLASARDRRLRVRDKSATLALGDVSRRGVAQLNSQDWLGRFCTRRFVARTKDASEL